jgi:hypothetical protein
MRKKHQALARSTQIAVMAISLLLTALAAICGAIQSFLSAQAKAPGIAIGSKDPLELKKAICPGSAFAANYGTGADTASRHKGALIPTIEGRRQLAPDFMQPDVKDVYYEEFNNFLDCIWREA